MRVRGALCLTLAAGIWGGMYAFSNWVLGREYIQPFGLLVVRLAATALVLGVALRRQGPIRLTPAEWPAAAALGFTGFVLSLGSQFVGTKWAGAANGALITSTSPAFITLFGALLLRERLTWRQAAGLALATAGVALVIGPGALVAGGGGRALWGKLLLLVAGATWGLYTVLAKGFARRHGALAATFWACATGALFNLPLALLEPAPRPLAEWPLTAWVGVAYIALISTAVAFYLWNYGFQFLDAAAGSVFFFAQPVVGALLGWLALGEHLGAGFWAGGALVAAGVLLAVWE